ncbi:MAG: NapC/NirT family cytochrome c [Deltaproteobacteria bacterium]|nr:NapC/NirT family cytochrome c [Deltaproteobacteria bacterium]
MPRWVKTLVLIGVGIVLAFPLFSLTYYTMVRTSTPEFCATCHEIQPAVNQWRTSSHVVNTKGFVADCMDCHLPAPQDTYDFFVAKTVHGIKDVFVHLSGEPYDAQRMRERAWATIANDQCMKCHRNLLYMPYKRGAMLAHRSVIYPLPGYEKKCTDCHRNLVHNPKPLYAYGS